MNELFQKLVSTPLGPMFALASSKGLCALEFQTEKREELWDRRKSKYFGSHSVEAKQIEVFGTLEKWLEQYFEKNFRNLPTISLDLRGTDFERRVWNKLLKIPIGNTLTYGGLAEILESKSAARAVGNACRRNPVSLIVPCHRVIGSNSNLTGYGGGLENKDFLLKHEGHF